MPYYIGINELQELKGNLERDPVCNSSIIGFIENNLTVEILSEDRTYLVKGISDREWIYFASEDKEVFRNLLSKLYLTDKCFASLEDWMIPEVIKLGKVDWQLTTMRYFLPESAVLPDNKIAIRKLYTDEAAYIRENSNYKQFLPIEYIEQRIRKSFSAGITENNKLVAWAITHDDGAIGALHVLNKFRNRGDAAEIIVYLSKQIRKTGRIPIAQIEEKNISAIKLFEKLGFVKDRRVTWLVLK